MAPVWQQCLTNWCSSHERCDWLERPRKAGLWKEVFLWWWWFGLIMNKVYFYSVNVPQKSFHLRHHDLWPAPLTLIIKDCIQTMDRGRSCTSCLPVKSFKWCNKAKTSLSVTYLLPWLLSPRVSSSPPLFASSEGGSRTRGEEVREGNFGRSVCEEQQLGLEESSRDWITFDSDQYSFKGLFVMWVHVDLQDEPYCCSEDWKLHWALIYFSAFNSHL